MTASRPNVLLVTIDSLRADSVRDDAVRTPTLDELATAGTTYTQAFAQGPFTTFSMPSLFTGRYPSDLQYAAFSESTVGVYIDEEPTITTMLADAGYETAGFHSNPLLSTLFGFDRGFETFDARLPLSGAEFVPGRGKILTDKLLRLVRKYPYLPAEKLTRRGLEWLDARAGDRPFFLWLHYMDVHGPYQPKSGNAYLNKLRAERLWRKAVTDPETLSTGERNRLREWYRDEITYTDRCLGTLLDGLGERGLREETVTVVTADHGEQFGEHGRFSHPHQLYDELVHVPLLVDGPDRENETVDDVVELTDVAPTLGRAAGVQPPASFVGTPLPTATTDDETRSERRAISEADVVPTYVGSLRTDRWKLIRTGDGEKLYDLARDPAEETDVRDDHESVAAELSERLDDHLAAEGRAVGAGRSVTSVDIDSSETEDRLRDLGYLE